ncbi:MAG: hypothetical protein R2748_03585 [Bryobacterales bacterium]
MKSKLKSLKVKEIPMNTRQFLLALIAGFGLLQGIGAAQITMPVDANIPFSFVVGDTTLGPGKYVITMQGDENILVRSANDHAAVDHIVIPAMTTSAPKETELVFNRYGNREFLTKVFLEGNSNGVELTQSKLERELMGKGQKPVTHSHPAKCECKMSSKSKS